MSKPLITVITAIDALWDHESNTSWQLLDILLFISFNLFISEHLKITQYKMGTESLNLINFSLPFCFQFATRLRNTFLFWMQTCKSLYWRQRIGEISFVYQDVVFQCVFFSFWIIFIISWSFCYQCTRTFLLQFKTSLARFSVFFLPELWMSQCRGCLLTKRWSLGLVLYSMLILQLHHCFLCTPCMHVTSNIVLCNCHEVSKVSSGGRLVTFCMGIVGEVVEVSFH